MTSLILIKISLTVSILAHVVGWAATIRYGSESKLGTRGMILSGVMLVTTILIALWGAQ